MIGWRMCERGVGIGDSSMIPRPARYIYHAQLRNINIMLGRWTGKVGGEGEGGMEDTTSMTQEL